MLAVGLHKQIINLSIQQNCKTKGSSSIFIWRPITIIDNLYITI